MDDGFQNPSLAKDLSLVVVDGGVGVGNGLIIPAGPLRAPLEAQIAAGRGADRDRRGGQGRQTDRGLRGAGQARAEGAHGAAAGPPLARVLPVIGFAGIARPAKFFATLRNEGARLIDTRAFPDHYRYSERQARSLLKEAKDHNAMLVTTEKDYVRLDGDAGVRRGRAKASRPAIRHRD